MINYNIARTLVEIITKDYDLRASSEDQTGYLILQHEKERKITGILEMYEMRSLSELYARDFTSEFN